MFDISLDLKSEVKISFQVPAGKEEEQRKAVESIISSLSPDERLTLAKAVTRPDIKKKALNALKLFKL